MDHPTCDGEHLLVHKLRDLPSFVPELDFVAEAEGRIVGHIIYSIAKVRMPDNQEIEVLNFGPLSVHPDYKRMGVGSALMRHSIAEATRLGYRAIIFYGHPDYYPRFGFRRASRYGIVSSGGGSWDALMAMELYDRALDGVTGRYIEDEVYEVDPKEMAEFEKEFPYKEPIQLPPVELLTDHLPERVKQTFEEHGIKFVSQLHRLSGAELLNWDGMDEQLLVKINKILSQLGQPCKLLPSSYILQLTELGVRNPVGSLIRSKARISLYRVESEGKKLILKVFENREDAREIDNYLMLSKLGIPTLPLLGYTKNAILLPDVDSSDEYRLGKESDLSDPKIAKAIAKWYTMLHEKGRDYLSGSEIPMYDESDLITANNMAVIAEKTGTTRNILWQVITENYNMIRSRIDALRRTLTYNDFYWTNLIVSKNGESALMFDYNLLGKGIAYGDIRNVTSSLSNDASEAFIQEYGDNIDEEEKKADAFISPLVTLINACEHETFPSWAKGSLEELKNGDVLKHLKEWLNMEVL
ncbi:MAG: GNAT family N-acetyltransferase [Lachnospiraceae bacterium]|nr:GNAT family N-acetyltransferase [Lachnospiraceae bacterium]